LLVEPNNSKQEETLFFDDYRSSVWKNLSSEAKGHFKKADEKRKRTIRENSSIQTYIISEKEPVILPDHNFIKNQSKLKDIKEKKLFSEKIDENIPTQ
jgi:hypothetical protein